MFQDPDANVWQHLACWQASPAVVLAASGPVMWPRLRMGPCDKAQFFENMVSTMALTRKQCTARRGPRLLGRGLRALALMELLACSAQPVLCFRAGVSCKLTFLRCESRRCLEAWSSLKEKHKSLEMLRSNPAPQRHPFGTGSAW